MVSKKLWCHFCFRVFKAALGEGLLSRCLTEIICHSHPVLCFLQPLELVPQCDLTLPLLLFLPLLELCGPETFFFFKGMNSLFLH